MPTTIAGRIPTCPACRTPDNQLRFDEPTGCWSGRCCGLKWVLADGHFLQDYEFRLAAQRAAERLQAALDAPPRGREKAPASQ